MMRNVERAISPDVAPSLRRWGLRWFGVAACAAVTAAAFRFATGGPTIHDWELPVAGIAALALVVGGATAVRWEGPAAVWLAFLGVVAGVAVSAHYGPLAGLIPVVALLPAAVALFLACRLVRSPRGLALFGAVVAVVLAAGGFAASAAYDSVFGPSHPASATAAPAASPVTWMWAGAVGTDGFTVVARVEAAGDVELLLAESSSESWQRTVTAPVVDGVARFEVSGLQPGTDFRYAVEAAGGRGPYGEVATFPGGPADLTIAFSSCARTGSNGAVFDAIRETGADLYIITGDLFYGDIGPNDPEAFRDAYSDALSRPAQAALYRSTPVAYVWDDHDYSQNDADAFAASRPAAMSVYRELAPHYGLAGDTTPIHQAFTIGRVRVIMTDNRAARDAELATVLGSVQYEWLADELTDAAARYPLVVWVNPDPWIAEVDAGADHWGAFEDERRRLAELIGTLDFPGFLMLSGDAHMVAIDDGTNNTYGGAGPGFPVFHAGALDRPGSEKGGPYSEGAFPGGGQFGVVEIDDDGGVLQVRLSGRDWTGEEIVSYRFATELR